MHLSRGVTLVRLVCCFVVRSSPSTRGGSGARRLFQDVIVVADSAWELASCHVGFPVHVWRCRRPSPYGGLDPLRRETSATTVAIHASLSLSLSLSAGSGIPLRPRGRYPADVSLDRCCGCRGHQACLGGSPECVWHISRVSGGLERENRISEAAIEPPRAGFDACGGCTVLGLHGELPGILISILGQPRPSLYGSGPGRVSIAQPAEVPFSCAPRRSARHRARSGSDQIEGTGTTRDPRRPKGPVIGKQGHGDRPAVA